MLEQNWPRRLSRPCNHKASRYHQANPDSVFRGNLAVPGAEFETAHIVATPVVLEAFTSIPTLLN